MSLKVRFLALMLFLTLAISGVVCTQDNIISSGSKGVPSIQNWASTSGTTHVISAAPNPSGYISAPKGSYTESTKNIAEKGGAVIGTVGRAADIATSEYMPLCVSGATVGSTVAVSGTTVSVGSLAIPSVAAGILITAASCAPVVLSQIFDYGPDYSQLGKKFESWYIKANTKTYQAPSNPKPYTPNPEWAREEWRTASWIGANGGPGQASLSDVGESSFSSSESSSSENDGSTTNNVDIEISGSDPNLPGWSEVPPCI